MDTFTVPIQSRSLPCLLFLFSVVAALGAQSDNNQTPAWQLVSTSYCHLRLVQTGTGTSSRFAECNNTVVGGEVLVPGAGNVQPSFTDCARQCSGNLECDAFNFCPVDIGGPCPIDSSGQVLPVGACQLVHQQTAHDGRGVIELASQNAKLGSAGVLIRVQEPDSAIPAGYSIFLAMSLLTSGDLYNCTGSVVPGGCVLTDPLPAIIERCNALEACQAVVAGSSWGTYSNYPYGILKGSYSGIAVGAAAAALATAGVFMLLLGRRRLHEEGLMDLEAGAKPSGSTSSGVPGSAAGSQLEDVAAVWGVEGETTATQKVIAQLLAEAPGPQWQDVVVPRRHIKFCTKDGKPIKLGSGASGSVFRGLFNEATPCALKVFDFHEEPSLPKHFIQEALLLRRMAHPNIVQFLGVSVTDDRGVLLMELVGVGDLWRALRADAEREGGRLYAWGARGHQVALQVAAGLLYLHQQQIVHMDLKPQNVLLARDGAAKIADVGFSRKLHASHVSGLDGRIGTFTWCAPEVLLDGRAGYMSDIYSYGILLWQICTGEEPVRGYMEPLHVPEHCPPAVAELQARCVQQDPADRPTAAEIVQVLRSASARSLPPVLAPTAPLALTDSQVLPAGVAALPGCRGPVHDSVQTAVSGPGELAPAPAPVLIAGKAPRERAGAGFESPRGIGEHDLHSYFSRASVAEGSSGALSRQPSAQGGRGAEAPPPRQPPAEKPVLRRVEVVRLPAMASPFEQQGPLKQERQQRL